MSKSHERNPSSTQKEKRKLFDGLIKSVAGLVAVVVILIGLVLLLVFQPEISARLSTFTSEESTENPQPLTDFSTELVDGKDVETGLLAGDGLELVKAHCTACHSSALILQNRFTREGWHEKIVWMQETQGLWPLGENESIILDYLAANYAPEAPRGRRVPLTDIEWYELKE
ncbi:hypothetical protein [Algoriphagus yeomjeoni]|uniref:Sulfite dehydrogenase (Cytochrome) subunit SorB n=1 Tax=Algoriphagus yeomjeoni TaxID=291403 RepID=A0A327P6M4_9BACT|nr:hypothetical protein [Algoriphagus yeomjeoni]RAI87908.1 hypothetical protein LV83_02825 [Algoriphagus yeomjeoni]